MKLYVAILPLILGIFGAEASDQSARKELHPDVKSAINELNDLAAQRERNNAEIEALRAELDKMDRMSTETQNEVLDGLNEQARSAAHGLVEAMAGDKNSATIDALESAQSYEEAWNLALDVAANEGTARDMEEKISDLAATNDKITKSIATGVATLAILGPIASSSEKQVSAMSESVFTRVSAAYDRVKAVESSREKARSASSRNSGRDGSAEGRRDTGTETRGRVDTSGDGMEVRMRDRQD